uniref:Uncharacterized protein n=1 Tax=Ditylenchus dipsaci TaxID=166011 RepID=A0A915DLR8_9BILA
MYGLRFDIHGITKSAIIKCKQNDCEISKIYSSCNEGSAHYLAAGYAIDMINVRKFYQDLGQPFPQVCQLFMDNTDNMDNFKPKTGPKPSLKPNPKSPTDVISYNTSNTNNYINPVKNDISACESLFVEYCASALVFLCIFV